MCYYSFKNYLYDKFGTRVHRLSLNAGFTCPNRDGSLGDEGCIYCNEEGFSRYASGGVSLEHQIEEAMKFAAARYGATKYIAYFQNATGTYAPVDDLRRTYDIIRGYSDIVGLFISTRPDCIDGEKLDLIKGYTGDYDVWIEYGMQTAHDKTLEFLNRGHTFEQTRIAVEETALRGIKAAVHIILGIPGEDAGDMMETARQVAAMPVSGVKFHMFHVLKNTRLESMFNAGKIELLDMGEYANIIAGFIKHLPAKCVILRLVSDAKKGFLVAPEWMDDKQKVIRAIGSELDKLDITTM